MTNVTLSTVPTLTVDVYTEEPADLRRRLQRRAEEAFVSMLPGGMVLTESEEAHTYSLAGVAGWRAVGEEGEVRLVSPEGHVLLVRDGRLVLTIAK